MLKWLKDNRVALGRFFTIASAAASFVLSMMFFSNENTLSKMQSIMYDCGIDVLGTFICAALYFGNMKQEEGGAREFRLLTVLTSAGFLANTLMFFSALVLEHRTLSFTFVMFSKLLDLVVIYFFYRYIRIALDLKGKLVDWSDKAIPILMGLQTLVLLANIFFPVTFWVDEKAVYHDAEFSLAEDVYLFLTSVITTILIIRCENPRSQKAAALTFIFLPIFIYATTMREFGNASNYGMILTSLVVMYCVIFNDFNSKLVSTQTELNTATEIQMGMLPSVPPAGESFDLHASMNTAQEVGGDFYDCFMIDQDHLCVFIADVSGKGMPAALFMMRATTMIKDYALIRDNTSEILTAVNARLCENNDEGMFVTAWIGILDIQTMTMQYTNAGHNFPVLQRKGKPCEPLEVVHGLFLAGLRRTQYRQNEIELEPGDRLFLYTDGVTEAHDQAENLYGEERLDKVLENTRESPGDQVLASALEDIKDYSRGAPQYDDITMVVLTIKE